MRLLNLEHCFHSDLAIDAVPGRLRGWNAVKRVCRFFIGLVTMFKIVKLHLILNARGVPHRISLGRTVEDERDSPAMD